MPMTRRTAGRLLLAAPAAAMAAGLIDPRAARADEAAAPEPPPESGLGRFLAKQEPGLDGDQRDKVRKDVASLEQALRSLRDFPVPNDVPPAGSFRPLRSQRGSRR